MDTQPVSSMQYADISINLAAIDRSYHYAIPPELQGKLQPGCLVVVPFGKQIVQGVVLALLEKPEVENTLEILSLNSEDTVLTPQQLQLTRWLARETFAPLGAAVNLMLPRGLSQRADILVERSPDADDIPTELPPLQTRLLKLLAEKGGGPCAELKLTTPCQNWNGAAAWNVCAKPDWCAPGAFSLHRA